MNLEPLHAWLYAANGSTLQEITDELRGLRSVAGLEPYKNLPADAGELLSALMELERAWLAGAYRLSVGMGGGGEHDNNFN